MHLNKAKFEASEPLHGRMTSHTLPSARETAASLHDVIASPKTESLFPLKNQ